MEKTRLGVIGCSNRIYGLLLDLPKFRDRVEVVALCDPMAESVTKFRERFNMAAKVYTDHRDLVADPDVEWVAVGAWNALHAEHAADAMRAGKDVFCEKPMATDLAGIRHYPDSIVASSRP